MAPEKAPAFQFYPRDFLTAEDQAALSLEQCGAYIRLLCICWLEHTIPDDPARLARIIGGGITSKRLTAIWPDIRQCFIPDAEVPGRLRHGRLDREREEQRKWREKCAAGGRKGQLNRKGSTKGSSTTLPTGSQVNPNSSVFSPQSSVPPNPQGAGVAWELWRELTSKYRPAASPSLTATQRDYGYCQAIASKPGGADWWRKVMAQFLITKHEDIDAKPRTLGMLLHWWGWVEEGLYHSGERPKAEAAA